MASQLRSPSHPFALAPRCAGEEYHVSIDCLDATVAFDDGVATVVSVCAARAPAAPGSTNAEA